MTINFNGQRYTYIACRAYHDSALGWWVCGILVRDSSGEEWILDYRLVKSTDKGSGGC